VKERKRKAEMAASNKIECAWTPQDLKALDCAMISKLPLFRRINTKTKNIKITRNLKIPKKK